MEDYAKQIVKRTIEEGGDEAKIIEVLSDAYNKAINLVGDLLTEDLIIPNIQPQYLDKFQVNE